MTHDWVSIVKWPESVSTGDDTHESRDYHNTIEAALAVCKGIMREGLGGDGKVFPLWTRIEPNQETLRDARERIKRIDSGADIDAVYRCGMAGLNADYQRLAEAYMFEHPRDEGKPITVEWLKLIGFDRTSHINGVVNYFNDRGMILVETTERGKQCFFCLQLNAPSVAIWFYTRGDIYKFLRAHNMPIVMKPIDKGLTCPDCGETLKVSLSTALLSSPPRYHVTCGSCGYVGSRTQKEVS